LRFIQVAQQSIIEAIVVIIMHVAFNSSSINKIFPSCDLSSSASLTRFSYTAASTATTMSMMAEKMKTKQEEIKAKLFFHAHFHMNTRSGVKVSETKEERENGVMWWKTMCK
jgi:hypothetical protein